MIDSPEEIPTSPKARGGRVRQPFSELLPCVPVWASSRDGELISGQISGDCGGVLNSIGEKLRSVGASYDFFNKRLQETPR
jgi:hypothetical protein